MIRLYADFRSGNKDLGIVSVDKVCATREHSHRRAHRPQPTRLNVVRTHSRGDGHDYGRERQLMSCRLDDITVRLVSVWREGSRMWRGGSWLGFHSVSLGRLLMVAWIGLFHPRSFCSFQNNRNVCRLSRRRRANEKIGSIAYGCACCLLFVPFMQTTLSIWRLICRITVRHGGWSSWTGRNDRWDWAITVASHEIEEVVSRWISTHPWYRLSGNLVEPWGSRTLSRLSLKKVLPMTGCQVSATEASPGLSKLDHHSPQQLFSDIWISSWRLWSPPFLESRLDEIQWFV